jgi:hypothetical protein
MNTTTSSIRGVGFLVLLLLTFSLQDIAVKWAIMSGLGLVWASGLYLMARLFPDAGLGRRAVRVCHAPD